jgi:hypothetical protein
MHIPLRTSFVRTLTPEAAPPPARKRRAGENVHAEEATDGASLKVLEPEERAEALVAPGCGRTTCGLCAFENSLT